MEDYNIIQRTKIIELYFEHQSINNSNSTSLSSSF